MVNAGQDLFPLTQADNSSNIHGIHNGIGEVVSTYEDNEVDEEFESDEDDRGGEDIYEEEDILSSGLEDNETTAVSEWLKCFFIYTFYWTSTIDQDIDSIQINTQSQVPEAQGNICAHQHRNFDRFMVSFLFMQ